MKRTTTDQRIIQRGNFSRSLNQSRNCSLAFNYTYESLFYDAMVSFDVGRQITEVEDHKEEFKKSTKNKDQ
jgi:hypothetical protein